MTGGSDFPKWDMSMCRRNKVCDWRCLSSTDSVPMEPCVGCERHRSRPLPSSGSPATVRVRVNDRPLAAAAGTLLIDLLHENGFDVPTLCRHPMLEPLGTCRICLVEIRHGETHETVTACTYRLEAAISVATDTPALRKHRTAVVADLLKKAPASTAIRALAAKLDFPLPPLEAPNNCIQCLRCVRVAERVVGCNALTPAANGAAAIVVKDAHYSERCRNCGACLAVCPTGAVPTDAVFAAAHSECRLCELICPELAVSTSPEDGNIHLDLMLCKKCGLCVHICPENGVSILAPPKD